jgi:hypothetical protein
MTVHLSILTAHQARGCRPCGPSTASCASASSCRETTGECSNRPHRSSCKCVGLPRLEGHTHAHHSCAQVHVPAAAVPVEQQWSNGQAQLHLHRAPASQSGDTTRAGSLLRQQGDRKEGERGGTLCASYICVLLRCAVNCTQGHTAVHASCRLNAFRSAPPSLLCARCWLEGTWTTVCACAPPARPSCGRHRRTLWATVSVWG